VQKGGIEISAIIVIVIVVFAIYMSGGVNLSKAYEWADTTPTPFPVTIVTPSVSPSPSPASTITPSVTP
jgi:hypothetical protein